MISVRTVRVGFFEFSVEASTKKEAAAAFKFEEMPYNAECPHDCYQNIYTISGGHKFDEP